LERSVDVCHDRANRLCLLLDRAHSERDQPEGRGHPSQRRGDDHQVGGEHDHHDRDLDDRDDDQRGVHSNLLVCSGSVGGTPPGGGGRCACSSSRSSTPRSFVVPSKYVVCVFCATRLPIVQTSLTERSTSFTARRSSSSNAHTTSATTSTMPTVI